MMPQMTGVTLEVGPRVDGAQRVAGRVTGDAWFFMRLHARALRRPDLWGWLLSWEDHREETAAGVPVWLARRLERSLRQALVDPVVHVEAGERREVWRVLLAEGACVVLRRRGGFMELEDCFYTRRAEAAPPGLRRQTAERELVTRYGEANRSAGMLAVPELALGAGGFVTGEWINPMRPEEAMRMPDRASGAGWARMFGRPRRKDEALHGPELRESAEELAREVARWTGEARRLRDELAGATPSWAEELRMRVMENRMEAWARFVAIDRAYMRMLSRGESSAAELAPVIDRVLEEMERYDQAIASMEDLLKERPGWAGLLARRYAKGAMGGWG